MPRSGMIRIFASLEQAQQALGQLEAADFDTSKLSLIGREEPSEAHELGIALDGEHARLWGRRSALWNARAEPGAAMALAWVPFVGHVVAVGPAAAMLVGEDRQAPRSRNAAFARMLSAAGASLGEVRRYREAVREGRILLLIHGTAGDSLRVRRLLDRAALVMSGA